MKSVVDSVIRVDVPGAFETYFTGTGAYAGELYSTNELEEKGARELVAAWKSAKTIRRGRGHSIRLELPSIDAAVVLAEYAEWCLSRNADEPDYSEVAAAKKILERVELATDAIVSWNGYTVQTDDSRLTSVRLPAYSGVSNEQPEPMLPNKEGTMKTTTGTQKAADHRAAALELERKAEESFQRSDTDGFLSQWALGIGAREHRLAADIAEQGGTWTFRGLFDRETGLRVKAKIVKVDGYGYSGPVSKWIVLDENENALHWLPAYKSSKRSKLYLLGLEERDETAPAVAATGGSGKGLSGALTVHVYAKRTDGGFPADAKTLSAIRKGGRS